MAIIVVKGAARKLLNRAPIRLDDPRSLFKRDKIRTPTDIYNDFLQPSIRTFANSLGAKAIAHAKKTHEFTNRTGALQSSMKWESRELGPGLIEVAITAGGLGRVLFSRRVGKRKTKSQGLTATGKERRIPRRGESVVRIGKTSSGTILIEKARRGALRRGDVIHVNYAVKVEMRGFSVLKNTANLYGRLAGKMWARALKGSTAKL
jgi:hypothetical protein